MMRKALTISISLGTVLFLFPQIRAAAGKDVPLYGVFEVALTASGSYSNPYLKMPGDNDTAGFVVGAFTGPGGQTIRIDGFWDGGKSWKIRVAPTAVGAWSYRTASSDSGLNRKSGRFNCVRSDSKGFLRVDPKHPHHFMWDDGTPFYFAPTSIVVSMFFPSDAINPGLAYGGRRRVDDGKLQEFLDVRRRQGFNFAINSYYGFCKPLFNRKDQKNEGGPVFINYDPDRLNPRYHQYGDLRLKAALERGFVGCLQLGWPDQGILDRIGHTRLKRYWRYLIARYAAYNISYSMFGEVQEFGSNYLSIATDYADLTRKWDPYDHVLSTHTAGNLAPAFCKQPWLDYIILQRSTARTSDYLKYNKPVVNEEYGGYEGLQGNAEQLRPLVWDVRMRGGYFVYESWSKDIKSAGAGYARLCNTFFRDRTRFWLLEYHPELYANRPGLANPGHEYVFYLRNGGGATVDLSRVAGAFKVEWYNPRTGRAKGAGSTTAGRKRPFKAPDSNDWVLHLNRKGR